MKNCSSLKIIYADHILCKLSTPLPIHPGAQLLRYNGGLKIVPYKNGIFYSCLSAYRPNQIIKHTLLLRIELYYR